MKVTLTIPLAILCLLLGAAVDASATWVTIQIEGVVDNVIDSDNYLEGKINIGDPITGWYSYDTGTPDTNPSEWIGDYWHYAMPAGIALTTQGFYFKTDPVNVRFLVSAGNAGGPYTTDDYLVSSYKNVPVDGGIPVDSISWWLNDTRATAISSPMLVSDPPVLDNWTSNHLRVESDRRFLIDAHVTSAVPEPGTLFLIALGALGGTFRRTSKH